MQCRRPPSTGAAILHTTGDPTMTSTAAATDQQNAPTADQPDAKKDKDRSAGGQFLPGNPGGPGNPFARNVASLRAAFLRRLTPEHIEEIAGILHEKARSGDLAAIRLLLAYSIGKPAPTVNPDRLDIQEWQIAQETSVQPSELKEAIK